MFYPGYQSLANPGIQYCRRLILAENFFCDLFLTIFLRLKNGDSGTQGKRLAAPILSVKIRIFNDRNWLRKSVNIGRKFYLYMILKTGTVSANFMPITRFEIAFDQWIFILKLDLIITVCSKECNFQRT